MAFQFSCPACAAALVAPDDMAGHQMRCGACRAVFAVPQPPQATHSAAPTQDADPPRVENPPFSVDPDYDPEPRRSRRDEPLDRPRRRRRRPPPPPRGRGPLVVLAIIFGVLLVGSCACCGGGYLLIPGEKWHRHESPEGGFAVDLPAPVTKDMAIAGFKPEPGQKLEGASLWKRGEFYFVTYVDILPRSMRAVNDEGLLEEAVKGIREEPGVRVVRDEKITVSGFPAREVEYLYSDGGTYIARFVIADRRIYGVAAGGRFVRPGNANVRRFLDSFEVTDPMLQGGVAFQKQQQEEQAKKEAEQRAAEERMKREAVHRQKENEAFRTTDYRGPRPGDPRALSKTPGDLVYFPLERPRGENRRQTSEKPGIGRWGNWEPHFRDVVPLVGAGVRGEAVYLTEGTDPLFVALELDELPVTDLPTGANGYTVACWYRVRHRELALFDLMSVDGPHVSVIVREKDAAVYTPAGVFSTPRPAGDGWHHAALVFEPKPTGAVAVLYLDGAPAARGAGGTPFGLERGRLRVGRTAGGWKGLRDHKGEPCEGSRSDYAAALDEFCLIDRPLTEVEVRQLAGRSPPPALAPKQYGPEFRTPFPVPAATEFPGLKTYYPFDELTGPHTPAAVGAGTGRGRRPELVVGPRGTALRVTAGAVPALPGWAFKESSDFSGVEAGAPFTLALWVRTEAGKKQPRVLVSASKSEFRYLQYSAIAFNDKGELEAKLFELQGEREQTATDTRAGLTAGEWTHLALGRRENGEIWWAVNGKVKLFQEKYTGSVNLSGFYLGHLGAKFDSSQPVTAEFDEFCVFDRELTDDEIAALAGRKALPKK